MSQTLCLLGTALFCCVPGSALGADPAPDAALRAMAAVRANLARAPVRVSRAWIDQVYSPANPGPVWFTAGGPRPAAGVALQALRAAGDRGLAPDDYDIGALERGMEALRAGDREPDAAARADRALTATMLRFLSDLRFGRVPPRQVEPHYSAPAKDAAFVADLRAAVAEDRLAATIDAAEPGFALYGRLKRVLANYRLLAAQPAIALPPPASPRSKIVAGNAYAGVPALHAQLVRLGDLAADSAMPAGDRYTAALAEAVRRFQARHGLEADGILHTRKRTAFGARHDGSTPPPARERRA